MIKRLWRRLRQGLHALFAFATRVDYDAAREVLQEPRLMALFLRMRRAEQLHALRVMRHLKKEGYTHPDLLTAALLHDAGKSRYPMHLPERVLVVLGHRLAPRRSEKWGAGSARGWRRPFVIAHQHADWSAEDMLAAGASSMSVALACCHQDDVNGEPTCEEERLLRLLKQADEVN